MAILDFTKAFDTVSHNKLVFKLKHYGINDNSPKWIGNFQKQISQCIVVDGEHSSQTHVDFVKVPKPLLFLLHINDFPKSV